MARGRRKILRVLGGTVAMVAFVAVVLAVLVRQAGGWGVPYFSFTSAHGSHCTNDIAGYTCTPLTLADVEFFGDVDLPEDTTVSTSRYRSTSNYLLDASLQVPAAGAATTLRNLQEVYGPCRPGDTSALASAGLRQVCVMVNPDGIEADGELSSRVYTVGTGLRRDGSRVVAMSVRSR